ncbi:MAG: hypothetical protein F4137_06785, partial [Acidobacteria bacterium]|nr:hypothetical protein [Acidobacteriota bacterium]
MPSSPLTRRQLLRATAAGIATAAVAPGTQASGTVATRAGAGRYTRAMAQTNVIGRYEDGVLPAGGRARF